LAFFIRQLPVKFLPATREVGSTQKAESVAMAHGSVMVGNFASHSTIIGNIIPISSSDTLLAGYCLRACGFHQGTDYSIRPAGGLLLSAAAFCFLPSSCPHSALDGQPLDVIVAFNHFLDGQALFRQRSRGAHLHALAALGASLGVSPGAIEFRHQA
jgi:hypothetical protein